MLEPITKVLDLSLVCVHPFRQELCACGISTEKDLVYGAESELSHARLGRFGTQQPTACHRLARPFRTKQNCALPHGSCHLISLTILIRRVLVEAALEAAGLGMEDGIGAWTA